MPDPTIAILEALARRSRASRSELVQATGLSGATVGRTVDRLRREGVVREHPLEAVGVGRPPRVVELDGERACVVGIDAGGWMLRAPSRTSGARSGPGSRVRSGTRPTRAPWSTISSTSSSTSGRRSGRERSWPRRPGSRASSTTDPVGCSYRPICRASTGSTSRLPSRSGSASRSRSTTTTSSRRSAKRAVGAAIGCRDVVFLSLGFGLGAGIIVDGRPVRGVAHAAGAIAYLAPGRLEDRASRPGHPDPLPRGAHPAARDGRAAELEIDGADRARP